MKSVVISYIIRVESIRRFTEMSNILQDFPSWTRLGYLNSTGGHYMADG